MMLAGSGVVLGLLQEGTPHSSRSPAGPAGFGQATLMPLVRLVEELF